MSSPIAKILGVITARGGSKGVPGKNIKPLLGKPLIAYTIEAAKNSGVFDRLILSTDDPKIAEVARQYGCEVPFLRPAELAQDKTPHLPVMQHAIQWLKDNQQYQPDYITILQPTSPLRQPFHIQEAVALALQTDADSVVGVTEVPGHHNPMWTLKMDDRGAVKLFVTGEPMRKRITRRQDLPKVFTTNGAIYLFKTDLLFDATEPNMYGDKVFAYPMADQYNASIDTLEDWDLTERLMKELQTTKNS